MRPVAHPHEFVSPDDTYCAYEHPDGRFCNRPKGNRVHDIATAEPGASGISDVELIDTAIRACLVSGMREFSANDMQHALSRVSNRRLPGQRFQEWCKRRLIVKAGRTTPSTNPAARGHEVQIYKPGPNWKGASR